jgi:hypothetical protein
MSIRVLGHFVRILGTSTSSSGLVTPPEVEIHSIAEFDAIKLGGEYEELIRVVLRNLELPQKDFDTMELEAVVKGRSTGFSAR